MASRESGSCTWKAMLLMAGCVMSRRILHTRHTTVVVGFQHAGYAPIDGCYSMVCPLFGGALVLSRKSTLE